MIFLTKLNKLLENADEFKRELMVTLSPAVGRNILNLANQTSFVSTSIPTYRKVNWNAVLTQDR